MRETHLDEYVLPRESQTVCKNHRRKVDLGFTAIGRVARAAPLQPVQHSTASLAINPLLFS